MNWYNNDEVTWGKDDILDLLQEFDPGWEDHYYQKGNTVYFWGRRNGVSVYIYKNSAVIFKWKPDRIELHFKDPIEAICKAFQLQTT